MIESIRKITDLRWLNLFTAKLSDGKEWNFVSRLPKVEVSPDDHVDAVIIVPIHIGTDGIRRLVLAREYRVPIRDWEYSFPAGLVDAGETVEQAAARELLEETNLETTSVVRISPPTYSSAGMTDECVVFAFVECTGTILPESLDIEVDLYDFDNLKALYSRTDIKFGSRAWAVIDSIITRGMI